MITRSFIDKLFANEAKKNTDPWEEAKAFGIDTEQLASNLKLSYEQRALSHQQALDFLTELKKAKIKRGKTLSEAR